MTITPHRYGLNLEGHLRSPQRDPGGHDKWAWGKHLSHLEPQFNTIWALTDFTAENGATQVVPGSTKWPDDQTIQPEQITQAEMKAGSVLIYSGSVFHGGGANTSDGDRIGINITYALGWLRQEENQYLDVPPDEAAKLPQKVRDVIGYKMHRALGFANDGSVRA